MSRYGSKMGYECSYMLTLNRFINSSFHTSPARQTQVIKYLKYNETRESSISAQRPAFGGQTDSSVEEKDKVQEKPGEDTESRSKGFSLTQLVLYIDYFWNISVITALPSSTDYNRLYSVNTNPTDLLSL